MTLKLPTEANLMPNKKNKLHDILKEITVYSYLILDAKYLRA
jgi:hypothetical protein